MHFVQLLPSSLFFCRTAPSNTLCFELMFDSLLFPVPFLPARGVGFGGAVKVFFLLIPGLFYLRVQGDRHINQRTRKKPLTNNPFHQASAKRNCKLRRATSEREGGRPKMQRILNERKLKHNDGFATETSEKAYGRIGSSRHSTGETG